MLRIGHRSDEPQKTTIGRLTRLSNERHRGRRGHFTRKGKAEIGCSECSIILFTGSVRPPFNTATRHSPRRMQRRRVRVRLLAQASLAIFRLKTAKGGLSLMMSRSKRSAKRPQIRTTLLVAAAAHTSWLASKKNA